jgi:hypothetical protein
MQVEALETLKEIGQQLDRDVLPKVWNGGIVKPSEPAAISPTLGQEKEDGKGAERRPAAGPRAGTSGWQGSAGGSRPAGAAAPVVLAELQAHYEKELGALAESYPGTQLWHQEQGLWLLTRSSLLPGLRQHAIFLTCVCYARSVVRSWAFWGDPLAAPAWIGPRHTNFPDGSICAFEPTDGTWIIGDSLVVLLDLYTVWALRHLHLQVLGRWPGYQAVAQPYERILELRPDEYCGCRQADRLYGECCRDKDLARDRIADAISFFFFSGGRLREPPAEIVRFAREASNPPRISELL